MVSTQSDQHFTIQTWTQLSCMHQSVISKLQKTRGSSLSRRLTLKTHGYQISLTQALVNTKLSTRKLREHSMLKETRAISFLKYRIARIKRKEMLRSQDPDTTTRCLQRQQLDRLIKLIRRLKTQTLIRVQTGTQPNLIALLTELTSGEMS